MKLSIIIATRNRESILLESLQKAIEAVRNLPAEIIIVNDGSRQLCFQDCQMTKISILDNNQRGVSTARNLGATHANGEILLFVDDDIWVNKTTIKWLIDNCDVLKSGQVFVLNWEYPPHLTSLLRKSKIGRYLLAKRYHTLSGRMGIEKNKSNKGFLKFNKITSCSLAISKSNFTDIGGYNSQIIFQGEDLDFSNRLQSNGIEINYVFDVKVLHNHIDRLDFNGYLERIARGYNSQYLAERNGIIEVNDDEFKTYKVFYYQAGLLFKRPLINLCGLLPLHQMFEPITNRIIGTLSAVVKYQQWKELNRSKC